MQICKMDVKSYEPRSHLPVDQYYSVHGKVERDHTRAGFLQALCNFMFVPASRKLKIAPNYLE